MIDFSSISGSVRERRRAVNRREVAVLMARIHTLFAKIGDQGLNVPLSLPHNVRS
jgi:hypothetical protein